MTREKARPERSAGARESGTRRRTPDALGTRLELCQLRATPARRDSSSRRRAGGGGPESPALPLFYNAPRGKSSARNLPLRAFLNKPSRSLPPPPRLRSPRSWSSSARRIPPQMESALPDSPARAHSANSSRASDLKLRSRRPVAEGAGPGVPGRSPLLFADGAPDLLRWGLDQAAPVADLSQASPSCAGGTPAPGVPPSARGPDTHEPRISELDSRPGPPSPKIPRDGTPPLRIAPTPRPLGSRRRPRPSRPLPRANAPSNSAANPGAFFTAAGRVIRLVRRP